MAISIQNPARFVLWFVFCTQKEKLVLKFTTNLFSVHSENVMKSKAWQNDVVHKQKYSKLQYQPGKSWQPFSGTKKKPLRVNFFPRGHTINATAYCKTLHQGVQNKWQGILMQRFCLQHDNTCPHLLQVGSFGTPIAQSRFLTKRFSLVS